MRASTDGAVVAGVDFSKHTELTVRTAAFEADWRGVPVRLVYGFSQPMCLGPHMLPVEMNQTDLNDARTALEDLAARLRREHPAVPVETALVDQPAVATLIEQSRTSSLLVVGAQGQTGHPDLPVGSVTGQVTAHAHCPVIVINAGADQRSPAAAPGPVVAGLDDSAAAGDVLAFALAEAAARGHELLVVHADGATGPTDQGEEASVRMSRDSGAPVVDALRDPFGRYPDVSVCHVEGQGDPAEFLLDIGRDTNASLVAVGSRGHSGILGLLLHSVGRRLVNHADQPVAVVHHQQHQP